MRFLVALVAALLLMAQPTFPITIIAGQQVVLKGKKVGVPFHRGPQSSLKGRIPSGTQVGVVKIHPRGWVEIQKHDGGVGFVKKKYVLGVVGDTDSFAPGTVVNPGSMDNLPSTPSSFRRAKGKMYNEVYKDRETTFYCGCKYSKKKPDLQDCNYDPTKRPHRSRAKRTEAEHIVPASWFGQKRPCWRKGLCSGGKDNRACCEAIDFAFLTAHNDLHNLTPAIGQINALRSNLAYALIPGETRDFGACDFEVDKLRAEPTTTTRGDVARIFFYMEKTYGLTANPQNRRLLETWNQDDPVDEWEVERNKRIKEIQGNGNPFVEGSSPP